MPAADSYYKTKTSSSYTIAEFARKDIEFASQTEKSIHKVNELEF